MTFFTGMFLAWILTRFFSWRRRRLIERELDQLRGAHIQMGEMLDVLKKSSESMAEGRRLDQAVIQSALAREIKAKAALDSVLRHFGVTEAEIEQVLSKVEEDQA